MTEQPVLTVGVLRELLAPYDDEQSIDFLYEAQTCSSDDIPRVALVHGVLHLDLDGID